MEQLLLWFNLIAFTLMVGAMGSTYVVYGRRRRPWLGWYLGYQGAYALFLVLLIYRHFSSVYLPEPIGFLDSLVIGLRTAIDMLLLWIVPRFILALVPDEPPRRFVAFCVTGTVLIVLSQVAAYITGSWLLGWINKVTYNLYYCLLAVIGIRRVHRGGSGKQTGIAYGFLMFSVVLYMTLTVLTVSRLFLPRTDIGFRSSLMIGGMTCFVWGGGSLLYLISGTLGKDADHPEVIPHRFLDHYGITVREKEIIPLVLKGQNNREVAETLCISPRTVEAHIYNIYRKCDIRNKLELSSLVSEFR